MGIELLENEECKASSWPTPCLMDIQSNHAKPPLHERHTMLNVRIVIQQVRTEYKSVCSSEMFS